MKVLLGILVCLCTFGMMAGDKESDRKNFTVGFVVSIQ